MLCGHIGVGHTDILWHGRVELQGHDRTLDLLEPGHQVSPIAPLWRAQDLVRLAVLGAQQDDRAIVAARRNGLVIRSESDAGTFETDVRLARPHRQKRLLLVILFLDSPTRLGDVEDGRHFCRETGPVLVHTGR